MKAFGGFLFLLFAIGFGGALYLQACTASITPEYLAEIWKARLLQPGLLSFASFLIVVILRSRRRALVALLLVGLVECGGLVGLVWAEKNTARPRLGEPVERSFSSSLEYALKAPRFSNRSYGVGVWAAFGHGVFGTLAWVVSGKNLRRKERV